MNCLNLKRRRYNVGIGMVLEMQIAVQQYYFSYSPGSRLDDTGKVTVPSVTLSSSGSGQALAQAHLGSLRLSLALTL